MCVWWSGGRSPGTSATTDPASPKTPRLLRFAFSLAQVWALSCCGSCWQLGRACRPWPAKAACHVCFCSRPSLLTPGCLQSLAPCLLLCSSEACRTPSADTIADAPGFLAHLCPHTSLRAWARPWPHSPKFSFTIPSPRLLPAMAALGCSVLQHERVPIRTPECSALPFLCVLGASSWAASPSLGTALSASVPARGREQWAFGALIRNGAVAVCGDRSDVSRLGVM